MPRKGENIYKRRDGRWEGRFIKSRRLDGKINYGYVYDQTFREVRKKLLKKKQEYSSIVSNSAGYQGTVSNWIRDWLNGSIMRKVKPSTYASYQNKLTKYVAPYLENIPLYQLNHLKIQELVDGLSKRGLSTTTIKTTLQILKRCMREAIHRNYLSTDPFYEISYPTTLKKKISALTEAEQKIIEMEASKQKNGLPIVLALHTGMRIGEISALKWTDVNLEKREIVVSKTIQRIPFPHEARRTKIIEGLAKSTSAYRVIPLNAKIWEVLKNAKETATSEYVVGQHDHFFEPRALTYQFKKILSRIEFKNIHFHQLRHTFATRLLEKGADIASVSALLGHHSVKMTLDIYIDSLMAQRKKWVDQLL
ncbi:hypothetical protein IGI37_003731 [Enterococcus sp. AZ194]|uniref:tyrosine-type recombinase/integrase n=1 Tax=Enterococcus sp. AZ194 TaxID=2774629 RepID=UPI003F26A9EE